MPNQDGLRFLFDIQDKISAKLAKIEAKAKASAKNIDKAFTRASKSQQTNSAKAVASEQRRIIAVEKSHAKAVALLQRESDARSRSTAKTVANEQKRIRAVEKSHARANALRASEAAKATQAANRTSAAQIKAEQKRIVAVEKSHTKAVSLIKRESDEFKRSMGRMASAATVAFAAVAGKAIQMAGGYDLAMRSVQAKTGATGALMDRLSEQSREMGRTTVHSATEAARGQAFLAQAGFDVHEVLEALPATLALATSGELDLASAADIASNVLSGFRLETDQAARVADVLAKAADSSNTNVAQLGAALAKAAPSAAAAKWSLEETAAAIGKLSDAGIQGEEAGTALKTMMAKLAIDGGPAERLMAKMGITVKDTTGQMLPLNDILTALAPHANDVGVQFELLGTRGGNAGLVLGAVAQDAAVLTEELIDSAGWAQKNADIMAGGLWGAIKSIQSIIESAYISFGERFTPAIKTLAALFKTLPSPIQEVVVVVGSLAGAMGGLMLMMPNVFGAITRLPAKLVALNAKIGLSTLSVQGLTLAIKNTWRALMGPVGWVIAIVAATVALYKFWRATNAPDRKLAKFESDLEAVNRRLLEFADSSPGLVKALGSQKAALERQIAALRASHPELEQAEADLEALADTSEDLAAVIDDDLIPAVEDFAEAEADSAQEIIAIEAAKRLAIVGHMQQRREAERAANDARVQGEADAAQAIVDIAAAKRRAIVLHIQKRRDAEREAAEATDKVEQSSAKLNVTLAALAGQMGGVAGQALNLVASMVQTNDQLKEGEEGFSRVAIGAAVVGGALQSIGAEMGGTTGAIVSGVGTIATAFATGGPFGAAIAAAGLLIKGLFSLGGPSEAELAARETFAGFHKGVVETLGGTQAYIDEVQRAVNDGWDLTHAEVRAGFILWGTQAGLTYDEAFAKYSQYEKAVREGNTSLMEQLDAEFAQYRQTAEETAAAAAAAWERAMSATMSAYNRAKDAGVEAYDRIFEAAIASGATQEQATERAERAQLRAAAKVLREERKKFVQLARFEAILAEIRAGNAEGAVAAGNKAAREVGQAWDLSLGHIADADELATGDRITNATTVADHAIDESERSTTAIVGDIESIPTTRTVNIDYHGMQTGTHGGVDVDLDIPGRAAGGPVLAGHRYRVGERGPEDFIPSRSGRIEPNGSSGGGGVDAKAIAKAVSAGLDGAQIKVDGRQLGRLVVRHQPLAVAELGGRR